MIDFKDLAKRLLSPVAHLEDSDNKFGLYRETVEQVLQTTYLELETENLLMFKLLEDIMNDFDPDKGELGPKCGPEMLKRFKEIEKRRKHAQAGTTSSEQQ